MYQFIKPFFDKKMSILRDMVPLSYTRLYILKEKAESEDRLFIGGKFLLGLVELWKETTIKLNVI